MTDSERALLTEVQEVYGRAGVQMSLNDVARHLIRRAGIILSPTVDGAEKAVLAHRAGCTPCEEAAPEKAGCPEGLYLLRHYRRVIRAHGDTPASDGL
ncbi:hypothetical protein [Streptomyces griseoaurantiacus]|uniref:hypothetical protein n=1 Tax=Streptomyces griseoaurantiacus TaxID=68213 RepID=UPI0030E39330